LRTFDLIALPETRQPNRLEFPMSRFVALLIAVLLAAGCASTGTPNAPAGSGPAALAAAVSVSEAAGLRDEGAFVLDVREPDEWAAGHIPGATLIPLGQLASRLGELERNAKIVVVCRSGNRSAEGRDILLGAGFPAVTSLEGGMTDWEQAGLPIETGG
jgi:rhodanese-related sulfurtransferase